jgi:hypothetical protein
LTPTARKEIMIRLDGKSASYCDGINRRSFLQAGFVGLGGISLPQFLAPRAAAQAAAKRSSLHWVDLAEAVIAQKTPLVLVRNGR